MWFIARVDSVAGRTGARPRARSTIGNERMPAWAAAIDPERAA
jgi:hypothetical protein